MPTDVADRETQQDKYEHVRAIHCLRQSLVATTATKIQVCDGSPQDVEDARLAQLATELEAVLEQGVVVYRQVGDEYSILQEIAATYERLALANLYRLLKSVTTNASLVGPCLERSTAWSVLSKLKHDTTLDDYQSETVADMCLDWAIACKRASNVEDCVLAHLLRMALCRNYATTDAVRLLGLSLTSDIFPGPDTFLVQDLPEGGIFERIPNCPDYRPSSLARTLGRKIRALFRQHGYSFHNCRTFLVPFLEDEVHQHRIVSANSFFHHRFEFYAQDCLSYRQTHDDGLRALVRIFLFGVAIPRTQAAQVLGEEAVQLLEQARLLTATLSNPNDVVGEVQIFPISQTDLFGADGAETCLFMTDWPMESLRLSRDAVMPVGYDTLELMSLSASGVRLEGRMLDLCCGCGIQGIFAWICSERLSDGRNMCSELVCSDVNKRACCFAAANMALNHVDVDKAYAQQGDLYEKVEGTFCRILSNPPFVAIPSSSGSPCIAPALYAVGGGVDGMQLLARIIQDCLIFLDADGLFLLVTEIPNIEYSCELLQGFVSTPVCIQVAYVEGDVEMVHEYAAIRRAEMPTVVVTRDWESLQEEEGVRNRALALISISRQGGKNSSLHPYDTESIAIEATVALGDDTLDEEDSFLTKEGIQFTRACLLES